MPRTTESKKKDGIETIESRGEAFLIGRHPQIIDQIHDAVVATDMDGYVMGWNNGATKLYGHIMEEALGKHITFLYPEEEHEFLQNHVIGPVKEKGSHEVEVRVQKNQEKMHMFTFSFRY